MENNTTIVIKQIPPDISNIVHFYEYENYKVIDRDSFTNASAYFLQIKAHLKTAELERKKIVDPINSGLRNTNDLFKRITEPLEKIKDNLNIAMAAFADSERKKLEQQKRLELEEQKKLAEQAAKQAKIEAVDFGSEIALETALSLKKRADSIDVENVSVSQTVRHGAIGTMAETRRWQFRVIDANLVPRDFLIVDEKAIGKIKSEYGDSGKTIPGVEFYQETSFSALK